MTNKIDWNKPLKTPQGDMVHAVDMNFIQESGKPAKVLAVGTDGLGESFVIICDKETGAYNVGKKAYNLVNDSGKQVRYVNLYAYPSRMSCGSFLYKTRDSAVKSGKKYNFYKTTVQVEWQE